MGKSFFILLPSTTRRLVCDHQTGRAGPARCLDRFIICAAFAKYPLTIRHSPPPPPSRHQQSAGIAPSVCVRRCRLPLGLSPNRPAYVHRARGPLCEPASFSKRTADRFRNNTLGVYTKRTRTNGLLNSSATNNNSVGERKKI